MARLVPTMLPTITCRPRRRASLTIEQRLRQTAAFVELDVDDVEATDQAGDVREALHAFVGRQRNRTVEALEIRFTPARQRLFHELHASVDERRHHGFAACRASSPGWRRRRARRRDALRAPHGRDRCPAATSPLEFELECARVGNRLRAARDDGRFIGTQRECRDARRRPDRVRRVATRADPLAALPAPTRRSRPRCARRRQEAARCSCSRSMPRSMAPRCVSSVRTMPFGRVVEVVDAGGFAATDRRLRCAA